MEMCLTRHSGPIHARVRRMRYEETVRGGGPGQGSASAVGPPPPSASRSASGSQQPVPHLLQQHRPPVLRRGERRRVQRGQLRLEVDRPAARLLRVQPDTAAATSGPAAPGSARTPAGRCSRTAAAPAARPAPPPPAPPRCSRCRTAPQLPAEVVAHHQVRARVRRRLHPALRGQLGQRRHRPARLGLRPEERPEVDRQPRPHQRLRHDLRHALPRHRPLVEPEHALRPERRRQLLRDRLRRHRRRGRHLAAAAPAPARAAPDRPRPGATRPDASSSCCMPCWRLAWSVPYGAMLADPHLRPGLPDHPRAVTARQLAGLQLRVQLQHLLAAARSSPRSSCRICHSGCGVPGAERRISCCSEPSGAR